MSILKSLLESEIAISNNVRLSSAINELAAIQEKCDYLPDKIKYTPEAVPVFLVPNGDRKLYVIECDNLFKLMDSQNKDEIEALKDIQSVLSSGEEEVHFDDIALLVKDEDIDQIQELCKKDKSKIGARTEQIIKYTNILKNIMAEGVNIFVDRN